MGKKKIAKKKVARKKQKETVSVAERYRRFITEMETKEVGLQWW